MADKNEQQVSKESLQVYERVYQTMINRARLAGMMGVSYGGARDLYKTLGYKRELTFQDYYQQYCRQDIAEAVIDRPIEATWSGPLEIVESNDDEETQLEKEFKELVIKFELKDKLIRLDRLTNMGKYGVLLLGLDDAKTKDLLNQPVQPGQRKLNYLKPLSEASAVPVTWDTKPASPRYGLPVTYDVTIASQEHDGVHIQVRVNYTRLLHITGKKMESETYGVPYLRSIFNRLTDLEKLTGGSAEMFWRGARGGFQSVVKDDYTMGDVGEQELAKQAAEYENNLRRIFTLEGVELKELATQVSDPASHIDAQISLISAKTGIPKRKLMGSERGELASSQDDNAWKEMVQTRRDEFAYPKILRPFVDRMIELQILPKAGPDNWMPKWSDLFAQSDKEKAEVGKTRAQALKEYSANPVAEEILPVDAFLQYLLGLSDDEIMYINEMRKQALLDEENDFEESEEVIEPNEEEDE